MKDIDILNIIYEECEELRDKLLIERILYKKKENKIYFSFTSEVLVWQDEYLKIEKKLQKIFGGSKIAIRIASPNLAQDFLTNIENYKKIFIDFIARSYPAAVAWLSDLDWEVQGGERVVLTFPDEFSLKYMKNANVEERLAIAIWDIFKIKVPVEMRVQGNQEARLEALKKERELEKVFEQERLAVMQEIEKKEKRRQRQAQKDENNLINEAGGEAKKSGKPAHRPIKGRAIAEPPIPISELTSDAGLVVIQGDIIKCEKKELRGGEMMLISFAVTDYSSTVLCKLFMRYRNGFLKKEEAESTPITKEEREKVMAVADKIQNNMCVRLRGECTYDAFSKELAISVRDLVPCEKEERMDNATEKRVELHMHTNMSAMDAMTPPEDLIARAAKWGHPAVAITDHGVVQAFPAAFFAAKKNNIKLIPGMEAYLIDEAQAVSEIGRRSIHDTIVVLDFETTGLNTKKDKIIEIGAVKLKDGIIIDSYGTLVNPGVPLPPKITEITNITDMMLRDQPETQTEIPKLLAFIDDCPIAAHNVSFDYNILKSELKRLGIAFDAPQIDTLTLSRKLMPYLKSHRLKSVCKALGVSLKDAHRAVHDATATALCLAKMLKQLEEKEVYYLDDVNAGLQEGAIGENSHIILLAASQKGLENLNRMVSISHLQHFHRRPHVPRSVLQRHREGIIVGSACEAGDLYKAVLKGAPEDELKKIARFYDYLEIQPIGNNEFMIRDGLAEDEEELRENNKKIVALGEALGIPVVATGDVHFLDPKDATCRAIIQAGQGFSDADQQAPLYFKTTDEMLEEFSYLGEDKCHEVVITNPKKIADKIGELSLFPKHPKGEDTFQPTWENAEEDIEGMAWQKARDWYGEKLPEIVVKRLEKELKSIIGYGFATLYRIAEMLVSKSLSDGYVVGSRGSVGSSFVATMCGITEVNPLPPHYRCEHCQYSDFKVEKEKYKVGVDLPDKTCPNCSQKLKKDGFDIPFEVFLGFKGDKVPDIDLNFSGEYQPRAHAYVEELFGKGHVFRAGTISALADKTAYGYVSKYLEERNIIVGNAEKDRLVAGCVGVKRTTGQHPGGMVVVPKEYQVYEFTAIQHPADDKESGTVTTHYDFNSMHDILVKLDILGHDDPTMIHMLEALTGVHYADIPLDDKKVMGLFCSPESLGVKCEDIKCNTGTYGVPEFGTGFVRQMLEDTKPTTMEELIRISGLSHGTDVWLGNAKDLIGSGKATLSECICTRDDIMNALIAIGMDSKMAFDIMESVRKGKGLTEKMETAMHESHVPLWFIDSCKKIKYMFPKGHAVAYVTMALRVAWYKVYYPLAYYAAYFTVRGDGFDASRMLLNPNVIQTMLEEQDEKQMDQKATAKEKGEATALEIVLEMQRRGFEFLPADLYKSDVKEFLIEDGKLRVPFTSLSGLGEAAAEAIIRERKEPFLSIEDLKTRAKLSVGVIEMLRAHGTLNGMEETSQISLFNLF